MKKTSRMIPITVLLIGVQLTSLLAQADDYGACQAECSAVDQAMATNQTSGSSNTSTLNAAQFATKQPFCHAIAAATQGTGAEKTTRNVYEAAAIVCAASCATIIACSFAFGCAGGVMVAAQDACQVAGAAGALTDVYEMKSLEQQARTQAMLTSGTSAAATGAFMALSHYLSSAPSVAIGGACGSAVLFGTFATARNQAVQKSKNTATDNCNRVKSMASNGPAVAANSAGGPGAAGVQKNPKAASLAASGGGGTGSPSSDSTHLPFDQQLQIAASTAGGNGTLLSHLANKEQIPKKLEELGTSMKQISAMMDQGASPLGMLAQAQGLPADVAELMKKTEQDVAKLAVGETGSAYASAGGPASGSGSGSKDLKSPFKFDFDMGAAGGGEIPGGSNEMTLEAKEKASRSIASDGDIFHSKWNGTIFQIVSTKLNESRDRIQEGEWSSPLNRALMGLSNAKPARVGSK